jgi:hypothetical protein
VCRVLVGLQRSVCLAACDHVSDCRFNGSYGCLDASSCGSSSDPAACQTLFGEDSLCVPGTF